MASNLGTSIVHVSLQTGVGLVAGGALDAVFPAQGPEPKNNAQLLQLSAEVVAQLIINGVLTTAMFGALRSLSRSGVQDPTAGMAFTFASFESQPNLRGKVGLLADAVSRQITRVRKASSFKKAGGKVPSNQRQFNSDPQVPVPAQ